MNLQVICVSFGKRTCTYAPHKWTNIWSSAEAIKRKKFFLTPNAQFKFICEAQLAWVWIRQQS